jgi:hypothetical protein
MVNIQAASFMPTFLVPGHMHIGIDFHFAYHVDIHSQHERRSISESVKTE